VGTSVIKSVKKDYFALFSFSCFNTFIKVVFCVRYMTIQGPPGEFVHF
jgi:hypothetical protein